MPFDAYTELISSQIPALQLLVNMGWRYLSPSQALAGRGNREGHVVLTEILEDWLRGRTYERRGQRHPFSEKSIREASRKLTTEPYTSLLLTNKAVYELLTLGTAVSEVLDGDASSPQLHYIDWVHPANNVYHVTDEFSVERRGSHEKRRPDMVLFVNGIPLVVIECKRSDRGGDAQQRDPSVVGVDEPAHLTQSIAEAISQMIRNQSDDQIPHLFVYSQLLLALHRNEAYYATTGTPKKFWSLWREETSLEAEVQAAINRPLSATDSDNLINWRPWPQQIHRYFADLGERLPTEQDRLVYALLRPERLLELIYQYVLFDDGIKKVARYQQLFAIEATMARVAHRNPQGRRTGGVIWHTTGSGKSLTMVMLAKALALYPTILSPRIILVTDRIDLDTQLYETFHTCGKSVVKAKDGGHLVRLVTGQTKTNDERGDIITTVINKFEQAAHDHIHDDSAEVFVLVDESHRSQYGHMHAKMTRVFPNACYIGFTGTPLTQAEKSTAEKFGSFIHKYPMRQAVADQAVVPLLYEGRIVEQDVDKEQLERWFERTTRHLTDEQKTDLKRKMSRSEPINATEQRIQEVAYNIAQHYEQNWRGTGFKAQLASASKRIGLKYLKHLEEYGIKAALVISAPDTREGHEEVGDTDDLPVQRFWNRMMARYGSEEKYNTAITSSFSRPDGVEIMIVVDKLLTGFDEPCNAVLYIDKPLRQHTLLQAIARVNRLAEGKDYGYIIDYRGVLGELNEAMNLYDALAEYDAVDVEGTLSDVADEIGRLPQRHSDLWAIFTGISNKNDMEARERHLAPEDRRQHFYEALTDYARSLKVALSTTVFYEETSAKQISTYKQDLSDFHQLRQAVKLRYAEAIDYRDYEDKVRKLMDSHIHATGTSTITELVNIFDAEKFDAEVAKLATPSAKADTILNRAKRTLTERMDEDPALYRRFAEMIEETINAYRQGRLDELELLTQAEQIRDLMRAGHASHLPATLSRYHHAPAYYRILRATLNVASFSEDDAAELAIAIEAIVEQHKVRDWVSNLDVQKRIRQYLDDLLYDRGQAVGLTLSADELDKLIESLLETAKVRDRLTL